jgi:hypothetical protein
VAFCPADTPIRPRLVGDDPHAGEAQHERAEQQPDAEEGDLVGQAELLPACFAFRKEVRDDSEDDEQHGAGKPAHQQQPPRAKIHRRHAGASTGRPTGA